MKKPAPPPSAALARALKSIGELTRSDTRTGRVFAKAEVGLTRAVDRVTGSPTYLRVSGALLRRGALLRSGRNSLLEKALRTVRMPTTSEVDSMRDQVRRLSDQVEAMGSQLERVARLLERQEKESAPPAAEPRATARAGVRK